MPRSTRLAHGLRSSSGEAFPYDCAPKYLIFDRVSNFDGDGIDTIESFGIQAKRTSFRSPWQNGIAERFVGSCRRELLNQVIVLNQQHLKRLMNDYVRYYQEDRTHVGLAKETPGNRPAKKSAGPTSSVVSLPRLAGLHHRYSLPPERWLIPLRQWTVIERSCTLVRPYVAYRPAESS